MTTTHLGELAALGTATCWTVTAMAFESAGKRIGSLAVNLIRLLIAIVFLSLFNWLTRGLLLPVDATSRTWIWLALSGLIGFCIGDLCLFRAFVVIGSRLSMLLMALVPPFTAAIGWVIMNEHLSLRDWTGMALTVSGVTWVILERKRDETGNHIRRPIAGIFLGLGGALGQAVGLVLSKFGMGDYNAFAATQIRVLAGSAGFAIMFLFIGWWPRVAAAFQNRGAIARTTLGATFGPFLGVSLSLVAVQKTEAGVAATIMALVPVLIIVPSVLIFKERVTLRAVIGATIAVSGTVLLFL
jgi:drug/metabolite transporter (DMT)-like permease